MLPKKRSSTEDRRGLIARWTDRLLPAGTPRADAHRARLTLGTSIGLGAVILVGTGLRLRIGEIAVPALAFIAASALVLLSVPLWLHRGRVTAASEVCAFAFFLLVVGAGWGSGGLQAPVFLLLPTLPLLATYLVGPRAGLCVMIAALGFVGWLAYLGPLEPFDAPWRTSPERDVLARALMVSLSLLVVGIFAAAAELQRRGSEMRRRRIDNLYRSLFKQSRDVVAVTTPEGSLIDINQAGLDLYGFADVADFVQYGLDDLYPDPGERERLRARMSEHGFVSSYETRQRTRDGRELVMQGTNSAIRSPSGRITHWLSILRDVTEARRLEDERARMLAALERKNAELEHFASTVAHDLKGPLFTLRGYFELLLDGEEAAKQDLEAMLATADRMAGLLDDLLEHARLGHEGRPHRDVSMMELARHVVDDLSGRLRAAGLEVEVSSSLPPARGEPTLIRVLLQNLVENALKFSLQHTAEPRVRIDHREQDGVVVYRVSDNGPGIAPEARERVFGLFFRQQGEEAAGSGIGLAAVAKIARLHGGRAWVEEKNPPGSTLAFTLARAERAGTHSPGKQESVAEGSKVEAGDAALGAGGQI